MSPPLDTHSELQTISQLLHLTYHRNKNQHRLAKWWSSFGQLRRSLTKLLSELEDEKSPAFSSKSKKKKRRKDGEEEVSRVEQRADFMLEILIPRCYLAFSGVVADSQWAVLGLMMLANLARLQKLIQPLGKEVTAKVGKEEVVIATVPEEDLGQWVSREEIQRAGSEDEAENDEHKDKASKSCLKKESKEEKRKVSAQDSRGEAVETKPSKPARKRKKKSGDAFDDLFESLI